MRRVYLGPTPRVRTGDLLTVRSVSESLEGTYLVLSGDHLGPEYEYYIFCRVESTYREQRRDRAAETFSPRLQCGGPRKCQCFGGNWVPFVVGHWPAMECPASGAAAPTAAPGLDPPRSGTNGASSATEHGPRPTGVSGERSAPPPTTRCTRTTACEPHRGQ